MNLSKKYKMEEIKVAFYKYFYGSGTDFFFPHPKLDKIPKKKCKEVVDIRYNEFLEILNEL